MSGDMRVCERDGEPLVFTFEYPGAEYVCAVCGGTEGIFGPRAEATVDRVLRHADLYDTYHRAYAERRGVEYMPPPRVGADGVAVPSCTSCGTLPAIGVPLVDGKPPTWYSSTDNGVTRYACSRDCIPPDERMLPW